MNKDVFQCPLGSFPSSGGGGRIRDKIKSFLQKETSTLPTKQSSNVILYKMLNWHY